MGFTRKVKRADKLKMAYFKKACILFCLGLIFVAVLDAIPDISYLAYLQKAGDLDTGCLHNLTVDNNVDDRTFTPDEERTFLIEFYNKTHGLHWKNRAGWDDTNTHHCQWNGIQCYPNNTYVKWIDLTNNNLRGIPPNLWKFRNLQGICLSRNRKMTGMLLDIISTNMTRLRRLCVSFADLRGTVPWDVILQLNNLEKLQICCMVTRECLKGNYLPQDIGILQKLQVLSIGENDISGELPHSINNLTKLWFLDLEYVKLTKGDLSYFSKMTQLKYLHMTNCRLNGNIPKDFGKTHPNLMELILFGNELDGELIGDSLLGFNNLQHFSLSGNNLWGLLPKTLSTLKSLKVLDLSHNMFSGFQENMTFSANLEFFYLIGNSYMDCDVKYLIGALEPCKHSLRILIAKEGALRGELPENTWDFELITYFDLSSNKLFGGIPLSNSYNLLYLFHVSLASNNLSGNIDTMAFFSPLKALKYLNITNNPLLLITLQTYLKPNYEFVHNSIKYSCPSVEITSTRGTIDMDPSAYQYSLCFCNHGFYGYNNLCLPCMSGALCEKEASSLIVTDRKVPELEKDNKTNEVKMNIQKGYWPCCNGSDDVQRLVKCSKKESSEEVVCNPSGKCKCVLKVTVGGKLKTSCNSSCICRYGNTGRFCSKCITGFYKRGDACAKCPDFRKNFPVAMTVYFVVCLLASIVLLTCFKTHRRLSLLVMFILVVALTILHFSSIIPGWFFIIMTAVWIVGLSTEADNLQSFICIAVFYFQSLDAILSEANIWPKTIIIFKYKITNIFNFELAQLTCSFSGVSKPEISFAIVLLLPMGAIFLVWLVYVLSKAVGGCVPSSMCKRLTIQVLLLVYFPITARSLSALSPCAHQHGLSFLKNSPWLDCHGTSYNWLRILGCVSLVLFVISVPLFVFMPLLVKFLNADGNPVSEETGTWLKPLYEEFKNNYRRWFPLVFLGRRLLLAVMLSLVSSSSPYQILGITFVLVAFIILTLITRPYEEYSKKFEFENMADIAISFVLLLSFVGLAFLRNSSHVDNSLVWLVLSINLVIVFFCVGGVFILFLINLLKSSDESNVQYEQIPGQTG